MAVDLAYTVGLTLYVVLVALGIWVLTTFWRTFLNRWIAAPPSPPNPGGL